MSSKRGRKRNDNLPPNRARDVQRAFRARRAAHLQALEHRVAELEEENDNLRCALNLPPASRIPLGRGPTGKDKAKPFVPRHRDDEDPSTVALDEGSQSPQTSSSSPHSTSLTMSSVTPGETQDVNSWEQSLSLPQQEDYLDRGRVHASAPTSAGHNASSAFTSDSQGYRFDYGSQTTSRSSMPNSLFLSPNATNFTQTSDRPSTSSSTLSRENPFSFNSSALPPGHGSSNAMRALPSPSSGASHPLDGPLGESMSPSAQGMTYGLRRHSTRYDFPNHLDCRPITHLPALGMVDLKARLNHHQLLARANPLYP